MKAFIQRRWHVFLGVAFGSLYNFASGASMQLTLSVFVGVCALGVPLDMWLDQERENNER